MEWHIRLNGSEEGPVSDEVFQEYLRAGRVTAATLVWKPGMDTWIDYGSFERSVPPPLPKSMEASVLERLAALTIDTFVAYIIARSVFWVKDAQYPAWNGFAVSVIMSLFVVTAPWVLFMAYCVSFHGGTPGKLALRLRVIASGEREVPFLQACVREMIRLYAPVKFVGFVISEVDSAVANGLFLTVFSLFHRMNLLYMAIVLVPALILTVAHAVVFSSRQTGLHDVILGARSVRRE